MTFEDFQSELEAKLRSMSDDEIIATFEEAGCTLPVDEEAWIGEGVVWEGETIVEGISDFSYVNASELALAA